MLPDTRDRKSLLTTGHQSALYPGFPEIGRKIFNFVKPRKNRNRAIFKNGDCNIHHKGLARLGIRYLHDIFTSLVDISWRWCLMIFALAYFVSWLFFALIWWLIMFTHGDLEDEHLPQNQAESNWTPCVLNIHNFTSCYLFSIETQYTIGYGSRTTTEECPQAIFIMSMQAIIGMTIDAFFLGIVFAKMTRPKLRTQTILFSKNAVVSRQDGAMCLMFRVGDMRKNPLIGAEIRAQVVKPTRTREGEMIRNYRTEIELSVDGGDNSIFFLWPMTVVHKMDAESPFYKMSASDMLKEQFEVLVVLEATVESTGQSIQARTSYVGSEVLWGYRFEPVVDHLKRENAYDVNYAKFNSVYAVDTPLCSACELAAFEGTGEVPPEPMRLPEPQSFDDDDDDDLARPPPPPPVPRSRSRSVQRSGRYGGYDEDPLLQIASSYILWGHRFEPVVSYNKDRQGYEVNYSKFDNTYPVDTPLCSGAELAEFYKLQDVPEPKGLPDKRVEDRVLRPPPPINRDEGPARTNYSYEGYDEDLLGGVNASYV
ncbi:ATP-sensitive inward rectifier potassium channel 12-like Protein [Tribolium castaneum]|uniref:ATP-sensitive inward rectifier potassium channel 12-like Protein n=1 Tax=Tribolium castaneum TaxID=7070 RepID=D6WYJ8_TRICA|nr:ATP-sensitive inward rectifier potassium channel 12-like Protein [Tribolium castaneum]